MVTCANIRPHVTHASAGPSKSKTQMASRSIQPFLRSSWQSVVGHARAALSPKNSPSHGAIWTPNKWFLEPREPITQTASRSVQQFLHSSLQNVRPYILYNRPPFPLKIAPSHGDLDRYLMVPCAHPSSQPKRHLDRFSRFAGLTTVTDRQTDRQDRPTGHVRYSVCNNRPRLRM